jgi:hypothetical protein
MSRFYALVFGLMLIAFGVVAPKFTFKVLKNAMDQL